MAHEKKLLGVFAYLDELVNALKFARENGFKIHTVYSPFPHHGIDEALGLKPSPVRFVTLTGGVLGVLTGIALVIYTCVQWKFVVSGKPVIPLVPAVVVGFEFCILFSVLFNFAAMLFKARLPRLHRPDHYDNRFSQDHFGVMVLCPENEREHLSKILKEAGAKDVHEVNA